MQASGGVGLALTFTMMASSFGVGKHRSMLLRVSDQERRPAPPQEFRVDDAAVPSLKSSSTESRTGPLQQVAVVVAKRTTRPGVEGHGFSLF